MIVLRCFGLELLCQGCDGRVETQLCFFSFRLTQDSLVNSPNIDKQLLFSIRSPNYFPGVVGKCVSKENPKSDLDLGFVNRKNEG